MLLTIRFCCCCLAFFSGFAARAWGSASFMRGRGFAVGTPPAATVAAVAVFSAWPLGRGRLRRGSEEVLVAELRARCMLLVRGGDTGTAPTAT